MRTSSSPLRTQQNRAQNPASNNNSAFTGSSINASAHHTNSSTSSKPSTSTKPLPRSNGNLNPSPQRSRGSNLQLSASTASNKKSQTPSTVSSDTILRKLNGFHSAHGVSSLLYLCYLSWKINIFTQKIVQAKQMRSIGFYREFLNERQVFEDQHKELLQFIPQLSVSSTIDSKSNSNTDKLPDKIPKSPLASSTSKFVATKSELIKSPFTPLKRTNSLIIPSPSNKSSAFTSPATIKTGNNIPNNTFLIAAQSSSFFEIGKGDLLDQIEWILNQIEAEIEQTWNSEGKDDVEVDIERIEKMESFKEKLKVEKDEMKDLLHAFTKSSIPDSTENSQEQLSQIYCNSAEKTDLKQKRNIPDDDDLPLSVTRKLTFEESESEKKVHSCNHPIANIEEQDMDVSFHEIS